MPLLPGLNACAHGGLAGLHTVPVESTQTRPLPFLGMRSGAGRTGLPGTALARPKGRPGVSFLPLLSFQGPVTGRTVWMGCG